MHQVPVLNFLDFIAADGEQLSTDSRKVAAVFGKTHYVVMRRIRELVVDLDIEHGDYFALMQTEIDIGNGAVRLDPAYCITRDGFALLAMGFTGKKALAFKVAYIKAFNAMAAYIKNQRDGIQFQYLRKELEYKDRKGKVSGAAREMRKWQDVKPEILGEMNLLLDQMQPSLLIN